MLDTPTQGALLRLVQVQERGAARLSEERVASVRGLLAALPGDPVGIARYSIALGDANDVIRLINACLGDNADQAVLHADTLLNAYVAIAPKPKAKRQEPDGFARVVGA